MTKISSNTPCPCHSNVKYKKCCSPYHKGVLPRDALALMRSRYCAYAICNSQYIIKTTHPNNPDYTTDIASWQEDIDVFSNHSEFIGLKILEFTDGESEAYVTFEAILSSGSFVEKSRFVKVNGVWLYETIC